MNYAVVELPCPPDSVRNFDVKVAPKLRHPFFAWLGWRPALAQHTAAEHAALQRWAMGRHSLVEIGVAEGVSALALRQGMREDATLTLIDPFHLSRIPALNFIKRVAHRAVNGERRGRVVWIEKFSYEVVSGWTEPVDLLFIDGDHEEKAVEQDWVQWSGFVKPGGVVLFHDACLFFDGWTERTQGPVKLVDRLFRNSGTSGWTVVDEVHSLIVIKKNE